MTMKSALFCSCSVRRVQSWWLVMVFFLQSGCTSVTPLPTDHQVKLGSLAIVSAHRQAEIEFEGFPHSKVEGAAKNAASVFGNCIGGVLDGGCSGDFCGPALIIGLGLCSVIGVVGGVAGAVMASDSDSIEMAKADISTVMQARAIQEALRKEVATLAFAYDQELVSVSETRAYAASSTQDYSILATDGIDTVLEVALTKAGTQGKSIRGPIQVYMQAHVRLVRTRDNQEVYSADYTYLGERLNLKEWLTNNGQLLLQALERGYVILGSHIYDSIFLLYPFPKPSTQWAGSMSEAFGLMPHEPELGGWLRGDNLIYQDIDWKTAKGRRPTFRWQEFPRDVDIKAAPEDMERIRNVRYDLVIAQEQNMTPGKIVYRRDGLTGTEHKIQKTLKANTSYFWTVRANFEFDGRQRVTEWGSTDYRKAGWLTSPSSWSYRFKTP